MLEAPDGTSLGDVTIDELRLAARNHALPLEALRYPVTPVGLHYLLTHYDIPAVDPEALAARDRRRGRAAAVALARRPARPRGGDDAGDARVRRQRPRAARAAAAEPAVAAPRRSATPSGPARRSRRCSPRPGWRDDAIELLFTGLDRGIEGGVEQLYERSLPRTEATGADALLAYAINGQPLPPQHGAPLRLVIAGWYGMAHVKWLSAITALTEPFEGYQNKVGYRLYSDADEEGIPVTRIMPRSLTIPPGIPDFFTRTRFVDAGRVPARRPRVVRLGAGRARRGERRRRRELGRRRARRAGRPARLARLVLRVGRAAGRARAVLARHRRRRQRPSRSSRRGTSRGSRTTRSSGCPSSSADVGALVHHVERVAAGVARRHQVAPGDLVRLASRRRARRARRGSRRRSRRRRSAPAPSRPGRGVDHQRRLVAGDREPDRVARPRATARRSRACRGRAAATRRGRSWAGSRTRVS